MGYKGAYPTYLLSHSSPYRKEVFSIKTLVFFAVVLLAAASFTGCKKDDLSDPAKTYHPLMDSGDENPPIPPPHGSPIS